MPLLIDLTGNEYGNLTVVGRVGRTKNFHILWECRCVCGNKKIMTGHGLRTGSYKPHCGCMDSIYQSCLVEGCERSGIKIKGLCCFHDERRRNGTALDRPFGVKGELSHWWRGGIAEYENHSELKVNRKIVLKEAEYICSLCGEDATQTHHIDLSKDNHSVSNLLAVCVSCNLKHHPKKTSKYKRIYGRTLDEMAKKINVSESTVRKHHKNGSLRKML